MQEITCSDCGKVWERPATRGPKPKRCPSCKRKHFNEYCRTRYPYQSGPPKHCDDCGEELSRKANKRGADGMLRCRPCGDKLRLARRTDLDDGLSRVHCGREGCGKKLTGRQKQWCSERCCNIGNGNGAEATKRVCPVCDREFMATRNQRFCLRTEDEIARGCRVSWCASAYSRHIEKGGPLKGKPPWLLSFDCAQCGKPCIPGQGGVDAKARKFCSRQHKKRWYSQRNAELYPESAQRLAAKQQRARRVSAAHKKLAKAMKGEPSKTVWYGGTCPHCRGRFLSTQPKQVQCGKPRCAKKQGQAAGNKWGKHLNSRGRKMTRITGADYEPIQRQRILERDGFICGICGSATDPQAVPSTPRYPSIDHVVPLSRGGNHTYENVQCACFECNWMKGTDVADGVEPTALPLF